MPSQVDCLSNEQATTAATTVRASTLWLSMATTLAACTMRASAVQWSSTTPQGRCLHPRRHPHLRRLHFPLTLLDPGAYPQVMQYGMSCKCTDILNYPSTIGICNNAGFYSPMAITSDCPATTESAPVCNSIGGLFTAGDPAVAAFSACDLTCNHLHGQTITPPDDTYQGCSFPTIQGTVAQTTTTAAASRTQAAVVVGNLLITATGVGSSGTTTAQDFTIKGPFSSTDPTGQNAVELHEDLTTYTVSYGDGPVPITNYNNNEVVLKFIDTTSGQPVNTVHLRGEGEDLVYALSAGGPGGTTLAVGGDFQGKMTATTAACTASSVNNHTVECVAEGAAYVTTATGPPIAWPAYYSAHVSAHDVSDTSAPTVKWIIMPWPTVGENLVSATTVDSVGNVYAVGKNCAVPSAGSATGPLFCTGSGTCEVVCQGVVAKFAAADGALMWLKAYPALIQASHIDLDEANDAIFVSGEMKEGASADMGTCVGGKCAMLARLSASDGSTHWARHVHHGATPGDGYRGDGEVHLGKVSDGPYIYVAYLDAGANGPTTLDAGTPYAGCKDAAGKITPEYLIDTTKLVVASDCPAGSTYVARTSAEAIPAQATGTGHTCGVGDGVSYSCVVKYHSFTGLPIWGSETPSGNYFNFVPQADGIICVGSGPAATAFGSVQLPNRGPHMMMYQSKLDLATGKGMYVQSIGGPGGDTQAFAAAADAAGNVYLVGSTKSQSVYATSMTTSSGVDSPIQTLPIAQSAMGEQFMAVKLNTGAASETPWCAPARYPSPCPSSIRPLDPNLYLHL